MIPEDYECDGQITIFDYLVQPHRGSNSDINILLGQFTNEDAKSPVWGTHEATDGRKIDGDWRN